MRIKKLVCGVGINDADYVQQVFETIGYVDGKQKRKLVWVCPFYRKWVDMLERCYSKKLQIKRPTYIGCYVVDEWHRFSTFKSWMEKQDWEGKALDKDLLFIGNKVYSPETCCFIPKQVNAFMTERGVNRGEWPIGVSLCQLTSKFMAYCSNPFTGKIEHLGRFPCPEQAHAAWLQYKLEIAYQLAEAESDPSIAKAITDRYENYAPPYSVSQSLQPDGNRCNAQLTPIT